MKRYIKASDTDQLSKNDETLQRFILSFLDRLGVDLNTIHLQDQISMTDFEHQLENWLRLYHNLKIFEYPVYRKVYLPKLGTTVGGNASGVASAVGNYLFKKKPWDKVTLDDINDLLQYSKVGRVFVEDRYGNLKEGSLDDIVVVSDSKHHGYGSQSYIDSTYTDLYVDDYNNVRVDTYTLRYD